jgi:DNA-binding NtrC family response regulator
MVEVILLTAYGNIPDGVQAIKNGAFAYITKGDDNNKILPLLARAVEKSQIHSRLLHLFQILEYTKGNKAEAARLLGIGIVTLYRKLESYGMKP